MVENLYQNDIDQALKCLKEGNVLLYPTDTVWGLGCDATNQNAIQQLRDLKGRDDGKPFIVLIDDLGKLQRYVRNVPDVAYEVMELSAEPVTVIFDEGLNVAKGVASADGTLAIRCVKDDFCRSLIRKFGKAIVSTSANISGKPTPALYSEIEAEIKTKANYVVKWRQNDSVRAKPSSVIRIKSNGEFSIVRK